MLWRFGLNIFGLNSLYNLQIGIIRRKNCKSYTLLINSKYRKRAYQINQISTHFLELQSPKISH